MTVVGNTLVVIAVFNYRPLRKVQNYFYVSLAASDLAVATLVMPLHVVKFLAGEHQRAPQLRAVIIIVWDASNFFCRGNFRCRRFEAITNFRDYVCLFFFAPPQSPPSSSLVSQGLGLIIEGAKSKTAQATNFPFNVKEKQMQ